MSREIQEDSFTSLMKKKIKQREHIKNGAFQLNTVCGDVIDT